MKVFNHPQNPKRLRTALNPYSFIDRRLGRFEAHRLRGRLVQHDAVGSLRANTCPKVLSTQYVDLVGFGKVFVGREGGHRDGLGAILLRQIDAGVQSGAAVWNLERQAGRADAG